MRALVAVVLMVGCWDGFTTGELVAKDAPPGHAAVRILAINDLHGGLEQDPGNAGVAYLAAEVAAHRTENTVFVSSGDLIGGSPLTSGLFHDEPTIEIMNAMKLDFNAVGNHELDEGNAELQRMQHGGCHPQDGCGNGSSFAGAAFKFLAANTTDATGNTIFPPYEIRDVGGAKIAFVGMTLENTPTETVAANITELHFADEVATLNALVPEIHAAGAQIIVLLIHQGGTTTAGDCTTLQGTIVDIANNLDSSVVWIASAHSHRQYNCTVGGKLVTQAGSHGDFLTQVDLDVDLATQTVTSIVANNIPVTGAEAPDATVTALVDQWMQRAAPIGNRVVGTITADITPATSAAGESPLGDVITDAMLAATGAQAAFMNSGGIRAHLVYAQTTPETIDGQVRYAEAFAVQPFSNSVYTVTLSGTYLAGALDDWATKPLQVSGLTYVVHPSAPAGSRVTVADVTIGGVPLVATQEYRVTVNSIVGSPVSTPSMANATNPVGAGVDLDLLTTHLTAQAPLSPPTLDRITTN